MQKIETILSYSTLDEINGASPEQLAVIINYLRSLYSEKANMEICSFKKQIRELENLINKLEMGPFNDDDDDE